MSLVINPVVINANASSVDKLRNLLSLWSPANWSAQRLVDLQVLGFVMMWEKFVSDGKEVDITLIKNLSLTHSYSEDMCVEFGLALEGIRTRPSSCVKTAISFVRSFHSRIACCALSSLFVTCCKILKPRKLRWSSLRGSMGWWG